MRNQGQVLIGGMLVIIGLLVITKNLFHVDLWAVFWPVALIMLGVWLLLRPRLSLPGSQVNLQPLSDIHRSGAWVLKSEEILTFVGSISLDLSQAIIPSGETSLRISGFVGDVKLKIPESIGVSISASAFLSDAKIFGRKQDTFLTPLQFDSPNYPSSDRKIRLETQYFICDLDIEQA